MKKIDNGHYWHSLWGSFNVASRGYLAKYRALFDDMHEGTIDVIEFIIGRAIKQNLFQKKNEKN